MYYIERPHTWKAKNRLWADIQTFVAQFENTLIADEISRDALVEDFETDSYLAKQIRTRALQMGCKLMMEVQGQGSENTTILIHTGTTPERAAQ